MILLWLVWRVFWAFLYTTVRVAIAWFVFGWLVRLVGIRVVGQFIMDAAPVIGILSGLYRVITGDKPHPGAP